MRFARWDTSELWYTILGQSEAVPTVAGGPSNV